MDCRSWWTATWMSTEILWDFKFRADKQLLANQPVVAGKEQRRAVVIDVVNPSRLQRREEGA